MNAPLPFPEPIRLTPELCKKLEAAVDQFLTLLDATARDPDLEPSLGAPENHGQSRGVTAPATRDGGQTA